MSDAQLDEQIAALKRQIEAKDREQSQLRTAHAQISQDPTQQKEEDERSIFVKGVDYSVQDEELAECFSECGTIEKIKILLDAHTGHPKGIAYVCFATREAAELAIQTKHGTTLKNRMLEVTQKRTNVPGLKAPAPFRGRGRGAGPMPGGRGGAGMMDPLTYMVYWVNAMGGQMPAGMAGAAAARGGLRGRGRGRGRGGFD
eukprot:PhM_4_TR15743/c0_g1_i1/m.91926/K14396/PABPN1, PABP2; polyadenylate-binding protein 2